MQLDLKSVKKCFEKSMDKYDENAFVQKFMAEQLVQELTLVKADFNKILELGCGTGLLTREINEHLKFSSYCANDLSEKSKKYIDKILKKYNFVCGNAQKINSNTSYDLIISNAMFQWFNNLEEVLNKYKLILNNDGILAFTTFSPENFRELKQVSGLSLNYRTEEELKEILSKNYEILTIKSYEKIMKFASPLELLYHMKNTGVNSLNSATWTFAEVREFCRKFSEIYSEITLTYSPILVIAKKLNCS